jgi:hypothetical protein
MLSRRVSTSIIADMALSLRIVVIVLACLPVTLPAADAWLASRDHARSSRQALADGAVADRHQRGESVAEVLDELIELAEASPAPGQRAALMQLVGGLKRLDPELAASRVTRIESLVDPTEADRSKVRNWEASLKRKREFLLKPTLSLGDRALKAGAVTVAYDCFRDLLAFEPDRPTLRKALGHQFVRDRWYGKRDLALVKHGLDWDDDVGWVVSEAQDRYVAGEYFDIQDRKWTTLAAANAKHADPKTPWIIQTEHLEIVGTPPLAYLVKSANALESFYSEIFACYAAFFYEPGKADVRVIFAVTDHPRLTVHIAADLEEYQRTLPDGVAAGWSAGMFIPAAQSSYFYANDSWSVMYHEFTHQILHEFTGTNRAPAWLTEGIAVYTESPIWRDGKLVLGDANAGDDLHRYLVQKSAGKAKSAAAIMGLSDQARWNVATDPELNYPAAGMVVHCLMEAEGRRYRADLID